MRLISADAISTQLREQPSLWQHLSMTATPCCALTEALQYLRSNCAQDCRQASGQPCNRIGILYSGTHTSSHRPLCQWVFCI